MLALIDAEISHPNALRLEYKRDSVGSRGDNRISNLVNDPARERVACIFGAGFSKELPRATAVDTRTVHNDVGDPSLIR